MGINLYKTFRWALKICPTTLSNCQNKASLIDYHYFWRRIWATGDIWNVVFFRFHDVTKQNGRTSVGALYREPLGEILVRYDN